MLSGRKLAGVLIESATPPLKQSATPPLFLVGVGINANIDRFPAELETLATSLERETGLLCDVGELEEAVRRNLFQTIELPWSAILARWRDRDDTAGRSYRAAGPGDGLIGTAVGVTDEGMLRLETSDGTVDVLSATSIKQSRG
jgi:BirA family biotin operon repressor/biotin-[acetyl-CoA-carboxylase] ligase